MPEKAQSDIGNEQRDPCDNTQKALGFGQPVTKEEYAKMEAERAAAMKAFNAKFEWRDINPPEEVRSYLYPGGESINLHNVTRVKISRSGNHYVESDNGKHIIAPGWRAIVLKMDKWTF